MSGCRQFKFFAPIQLEKQESIFQLEQSRWNLYIGWQPVQLSKAEFKPLASCQLPRTRNQLNRFRYIYFHTNSLGKSLPPFSTGYGLNRKIDWVILPKERWALSRNLTLDNCFYDCSTLGYRIHDQMSVVEKSRHLVDIKLSYNQVPLKFELKP